MKNILILAILSLCFQTSSIGQDFKKSKTLSISKIDTTTSLSNGNDSYKQTIYLESASVKKLKSFEINLDSYDNEYSSVSETTETQLKNISKIVKINIDHCACYCNTDVYYYLVTNNNEWIELPKLEQNDYDIGNTYLEYAFRKESKTTIELVEYREKINENKPNKNSLLGFETERIHEKTIKTITWTGNELQGLEEKYIVTAENGLLLRNKPGLKSKKIGKIYSGAQITIIEKTRFTETISDKGKKINGNWVKVEFKNYPIQITTLADSNKGYGYVFDGYTEKISDNLHNLSHQLIQFSEYKNLTINKSKSPYFLKGDFFGDGINDIAVLLKDKEGATKIGIINYNNYQNSLLILGNENDPFKMTDYGWVGVFQKVNKNEVLWSNYEDDFIDYEDVPENKKIRVDYNAIYMHASESCGGGFVYWKNGKFNWLQQE